MPEEVVVVGAGITGLTCAWTLQKLGVDVLVLESNPRAGGVIQTQIIKEHVVECGPNTLLLTPEAFAMINELSLGPDLLTADPRQPRYVLVNGRLRKAPLGPLCLRGLLRICAEPLIGRSSFEDESIADFCRRRIGKDAHDRLVAPLVTGIYAGDTERLSMASTFPGLVELERKYGSIVLGVLRGPRKCRAVRSTFVGGLETLPRRLARELRIQFNVAHLRLSNNLALRWNGGEMRPTAIVLATPAYAAAKIMTGISPATARLLEKVSYAPLVVAASSLSEAQMAKPPVGFGFLVPRSEKLHVLGTFFSSTLFQNRAPEGRVLFTSFIGGTVEPDAVDWPDHRLLDIVASELSRIVGTSNGIEPIALIRHQRAIPQYRIGHSSWLAAVRAEFKQWPSLFLAGNYLGGLSVSARMEDGKRTAHAVFEYLRKASDTQYFSVLPR